MVVGDWLGGRYHIHSGATQKKMFDLCVLLIGEFVYKLELASLIGPEAWRSCELFKKL